MDLVKTMKICQSQNSHSDNSNAHAFHITRDGRDGKEAGEEVHGGEESTEEKIEMQRERLASGSPGVRRERGREGKKEGGKERGDP